MLFLPSSRHERESAADDRAAGTRPRLQRRVAVDGGQKGAAMRGKRSTRRARCSGSARMSSRSGAHASASPCSAASAASGSPRQAALMWRDKSIAGNHLPWHRAPRRPHRRGRLLMALEIPPAALGVPPGGIGLQAARFQRVRAPSRGENNHSLDCGAPAGRAQWWLAVLSSSRLWPAAAKPALLSNAAARARPPPGTAEPAGTASRGASRGAPPDFCGKTWPPSRPTQRTFVSPADHPFQLIADRPFQRMACRSR